MTRQMDEEVADRGKQRPTENSPLLVNSNPSGYYGGEDHGQPQLSEKWTHPKGFFWIEIALLANVFLSGFDSTVTASTYAVISSDFSAANTASWLTTSYLITSTAFQPLYGRFSDILGRRCCFFFCTLTFAIGCLGCSLAKDIVTLNLMRALTGIGGGGLVSMATIINSDLIPLEERGMYQAGQNVAYGVGLICGASFGGAIADTIGWRWCFLLQVPFSAAAIGIGCFVIRDPPTDADTAEEGAGRTVWRKIDFSGSFLLILGLSSMLLGLGLGGNQLPWSDWRVLAALGTSVALLACFLVVEATTKALPIIPLWMLRGRTPVAVQVSNFCAGVAAYAFLFTVPLFFQVVLLDSASRAGSRLMIPALATPIGGLVTGYIMSRYGGLVALVRTGPFLMALGNASMLLLNFWDPPNWKHQLFLFPANLGQGIVYPALLFTFMSSFAHSHHAISSSTVYLIRSLGGVTGVALASSLLQNTLNSNLPAALAHIPNGEQYIEEIRHEVSALRDLPPEIQIPARLVYFRGMRYAFAAAAVSGLVALVAAMCVRGEGLRRVRRGGK